MSDGDLEAIREVARKVAGETVADEADPDDADASALTVGDLRGLGLTRRQALLAGAYLASGAALGAALSVGASEPAAAATAGGEIHVDDVHVEDLQRDTDDIRVGELSIDGDRITLDSSAPDSATNVRIDEGTFDIYDGGWQDAQAERFGGSSWADAQVERFDGSAWRQLYPPSAIPDSVVLQYFATTWGQGDATWADDATDDGSQDMSLMGDPQAGTLSDGVESVNFDGTDDNGLISLPSGLEGNSLQQNAMEVAIQFSGDANDQNIIGAINDGSQRLLWEFNAGQQFDQDPGTFVWQLQDADGNSMTVYPSSNPNLNDGNRHNISIIVNDASQSDVDCIVDGSDVPLTFQHAQNPSNFGAWDYDAAFAARMNAGAVENRFNVDVGAFRWHDEAISSQTIGGYPP